MDLNRDKLINALIQSKDPSLSANRSWDTMYKNKTCSYWTNLIWQKILAADCVYGTAIDRYEFANFCVLHCLNNDAHMLFDKINTKSRCISYTEFENYLEKLGHEDYKKVVESLEPRPDPITISIREPTVREPTVRESVEKESIVEESIVEEDPDVELSSNNNEIKPIELPSTSTNHLIEPEPEPSYIRAPSPEPSEHSEESEESKEVAIILEKKNNEPEPSRISNAYSYIKSFFF